MQSADLTLRLPRSLQPPLPVDDTIYYREELLSWHVDAATGTVRFLSLVMGDRDAFVDFAADLESVHQYDVMPVDDETFYGYAVVDLRESEATLFDAFDVPGLVIVPPIVYTGRETVQITVLGEPDSLATVLENVPDAVSVAVERVSEHQRRAETLAGRLTRRQFEALGVAHEVGYYDVPRTGSLAAVATRLECSESAASTLLRTAESALVEAAVGR